MTVAHLPQIPLFLDIGMSEMLVIGVVALIVVGPKDLPGMFRTLGRFTARAKAMAREFSSAMEAAADESGVREATDALKAASNPKKFGLDKLNEAADQFEKWDPMKPDDGVKKKPDVVTKDPNSPSQKKAESAAAKEAAKDEKTGEGEA